MMGWYGFGGAGFFGLLVMALFWIGLILLLVWGVSRFFPREHRNDRDVAADVLRRRYAAGEISEAEYLQAMEILGGGDSGRVSMRGNQREEALR